MKIFYTLFAVICYTLSFGQTVHEVTVSNFAFTPAELEIEVGDTVRWTNLEGFHNVDGNTTNFPDNPEEFGNEASNENWTYEYVFTIEGTYLYQCEVHPALMQGSINVTGTSVGIEESDNIDLRIFPLPAKDFVIIDGLDNSESLSRVEIYDITGNLSRSVLLNGQRRIDLAGLSSGIYIYNIMAGDQIVQTGKIPIQR